MIAHDIERLALTPQTQHGFHEVVATGGVYPAGAKDEVLAAASGNGVVPFQLGVPVHAQGAGGAVFLPGRFAVTWVDVVARVVHQGRIVAGGVLGELFGQAGVQALGLLGLAFGSINGGVGGSVENERGLVLGKVGIDGLGAGQVELLACGCQHVAEERKLALQLEAYLAVAAGDEDVHGKSFSGACCLDCVAVAASAALVALLSLMRWRLPRATGVSSQCLDHTLPKRWPW